MTKSANYWFVRVYQYVEFRGCFSQTERASQPTQLITECIFLRATKNKICSGIFQTGEITLAQQIYQIRGRSFDQNDLNTIRGLLATHWGKGQGLRP